LSQADRVAQAKKLYGEAGYGPDKPLNVELRYNTSENHKKIAIAIAAMLKQNLGVNVSLVNEEFKTFLETRKLKKVTQMFRAGWIGDYADPNTFAELLQSDAGLNDFGYASAPYDKLVKQAAVTVDSEKRADLLEQAERLMLADLPMMPIYFYVQKRLVKPTVIGYSPNVLGFYFSRDMAIAK
jgi:oligopeptide transport system substrate-binding protein